MNDENKNADSIHRSKFFTDHIWIILSFILFITAAVLFSDDIVSVAVNISALIIMLGFLLRGMGFIFTDCSGGRFLFDCTWDLESLTALLKKYNREYPGMAWEKLRENKDFQFSCEKLKDAMDQMESENTAQENCGADFPVEDYVNDQLLSDIGDEGFNDFVSNAMTGLGILGTFVGLAIGLKSFDASTAEAMTSSIVPLIDGIKVAFYTSIFGVGFSLIYGTLYRRLMRNAEDALEEFTDTYYRCCGRKNLISSLLQYKCSNTQNIDGSASAEAAPCQTELIKLLLESIPEIEQQLRGIREILEKTAAQDSEKQSGRGRIE